MLGPETGAVGQRSIALGQAPLALCRALGRSAGASVLLDGRGRGREAWTVGPLVAVDPELCLALRPAAAELSGHLDAIDALWTRRREQHGAAETGLVLLLGHEVGRDRGAGGAGLPQLALLQVDRSVRFTGAGRALLTVAAGRRGEEPLAASLARAEERIGALDERPAGTAAPARVIGQARTSLPRAAYLQAVARVLDHIARGDVYQANLCQRFGAAYDGDPLGSYAALAERAPAPRSAFVAAGRWAVASLSPETFLHRSAEGTLETWPIKGTRPRQPDAAADAAAARALLASPKDRAELVMIVDLERNDLARVCEPGSVRVTELGTLRSYAAVHHLVARIEGRLAAGTGLRSIVAATFPGGSISGAPKRRALEILGGLEPVPRELFTGALIWLGDDGVLDSSLLIRTLVFDGHEVQLGAGGGIVADSDPLGEWHESNHKARLLARALGFDPEEAA